MLFKSILTKLYSLLISQFRSTLHHFQLKSSIQYNSHLYNKYHFIQNVSILQNKLCLCKCNFMLSLSKVKQEMSAAQRNRGSEGDPVVTSPSFICIGTSSSPVAEQHLCRISETPEPSVLSRPAYRRPPSVCLSARATRVCARKRFRNLFVVWLNN